MNQLKSYRSRRVLIKRIIFWVLILIGLAVLFFAQTKSYAASLPSSATNPCTVFGCVGNINGANYQGADGVFTAVMKVVSYLVYAGVGLAVLFMIIGAYRMFMSNGNEGEAKKGRETIINALLGMLIAITSATIVAVVTAVVAGINIF
jgi:hypothetical protein